MAMALNLPSLTTSLSIFNPDIVDPNKKSLASLKYWQHFAGVRAEGYTEFIRFFEPHFKECEETLNKLETTEDESWIRSLKLGLEVEMGLLNFIKSLNRNFGHVYTQIKDFQAQTKDEETKFENTKKELKDLHDKVLHLENKQKEDQMKLEKKLAKLENMILSSSDKIEEKTKKSKKFADRYAENLKDLESKTNQLKQKSDEVFSLFEHLESEKIAALLQIYKESTYNKQEDYRDFLTQGFVNCGFEDALSIDEIHLKHNSIRSQRKLIKLYRFQTSTEIISASQTCLNFLYPSAVPPSPAISSTSQIDYDTLAEATYDQVKGGQRTEDMDRKAPNNEPTSVQAFKIEDVSDNEEWPLCFEDQEPRRTLSKQREPVLEHTEMPRVDPPNVPQPDQTLLGVTLPESRTIMIAAKQPSTAEANTPVAITNVTKQSSSAESSNLSDNNMPTKSVTKMSDLDLTLKERPLPRIPTACWEERKTPKTKGERIKILSLPDNNGYVTAKKKIRFFRHKVGLIPIYVF